MPRKKVVKSTETSIVSLSKIDVVKNYRPNKKAAIAVLVIGLLLLAYYKKGWFVAATVNGTPISNFELLSALNKQFRTQTLNQMINEKILEQEAVKKGITVSQQEIDSKIAETENQYGGRDAFNSLLAQQGIKRDEFVKQTKIQLIVEKLYANDIKPTDDEIKKFMDDNKNSPEATDEAKFKKLAENSVKQQKISTVFNQKFQELKQAAKVTIY